MNLWKLLLRVIEVSDLGLVIFAYSLSFPWDCYIMILGEGLLVFLAADIYYSLKECKQPKEEREE